MATSLNVGIKFTTKSKLVKDLNNLLDEVGSSAKDLKINFDTNTINKSLNDIEKTINNLNNKLSINPNISNNFTNNIKNVSSELDNATDKLSKFENKISEVNKYKDGFLVENIKKYNDELGKVVTITNKIDENGKASSSLETVSESYGKLYNSADKYLDKMQQIKDNGLINDKALAKPMDNITNYPNLTDSELSKTKTDIDNLIKNENGIISLDSKIKLLESDLGKLETTINNTNGIADKLKVDKIDTSIISNLKNQLEDLKNTKQGLSEGELINSNKIKTDLNSISDSFKRAKEEIKNTSATVGDLDKYFSKLDILKSNNLINSDIITNLKTTLSNYGQLSGNELKNLKSQIDNLITSQSSIVSLDNKIKSLQSDYSKIKEMTTTSDNLFDRIGKVKVDSNDLKGLKTYIDNLQRIRENLSNGGVINGDKIRMEVNTASNAFRDMKNQVSVTGDAFGSFKNTLQTLGLSTSIYGGFHMLFNEFKEGIKSVIEIENSLISLQRVYSMTDSELKNFKNSMDDMAMSLATNSKDMIDTVTTFKKLGYSIQESKSLAEIATKFDLAGDINNIGQTTKDLVAILKGFNIEASKSAEVTDNMNTVANDYAVTAQDISEIMKRSSSALATANNSFKQSVSIGTVAQEVIQDASKVGTALKTISARIVSMKKGELAYAKDLKEIANTDIEDGQGGLRSTFDILKDIGKVWDDLSSKDKATIGNDLFGKHNLSVGYAILNNAKELDNVMDTLNASAGSVQNEMNRYLDSTQAKLNQTKQLATEFWTNLVNSNMTKTLVGGLNELIKTFGTVEGAIGLAIAGLIAFRGNAIKGAIVGIAEYIGMLTTASSVTEALSVVTADLTTVMKANPFLFVASAVVAVIGVVSKLNDEYQKAHDWQTKLTQNVDDLKKINDASALVDSANRYKEALEKGNLTAEEQESKRRSLLEIEEQLATLYPESINGYDRESKAVVTNFESLNQTLKSKSKEASDQARENYRRLFDDINGNVRESENGSLNFANMIAPISALNVYEELSKSEEKLSDKQEQDLQNARNKLEDLNNQVREIYQAGGDINGLQMFDFDTGTWVDAQNVIASTSERVNEFGESIDEADMEVQDFDKTMKGLATTFGGFAGEISTIDTIIDELGKYNTITDSTAENLISKYPDLLLLMAKESFTIQDLIDYQDKLRTAKQNTLNESIANIINEGSTAKKIDDMKKISNIDLNNLIRQNGAETANQLGGHYNNDSTNSANADNSKGSSNANLNNIIRQNGADTANNLAQTYQNDVSNFVDAQKAKERASNQFMSTLFANVQKQRIMTSDFSNYLQASKDLLGGFSSKEQMDPNTHLKDQLLSQGYKYAPGVGWITQQDQSPVRPIHTSNVTSSNFRPITSTARSASSPSRGGGSKSSGSKSSTAKKQVENVENLADRYFQLNNELNVLSKNLDIVKNKLQYSVGADYRKGLESEINIYRQLRDNAQKTIDEERRESWELRVELDKNGLRFNSREDITNYMQRLTQMMNEVNSIQDPDRKEANIKYYKKLADMTKKYADIVYSKIPELTNKMEEYNNSIKEVYKTMTYALKTAENNIYETAKYYADKTVNAKKDAINKQIELIDKLSDKEKENEDLSKRESELADIKAQMIKYSNDTSTIGKRKLKELQNQYESTLKELNDKIIEQQRNAIKEKMTNEQNSLEETLQKYLDPTHMREIITNALNSGYLDVMDNTYDLKKAITNMLNETKTSTQEIIDTNTEWLNSLSNVASIYSQIRHANNSIGNFMNTDTRGFKAINTPQKLKNYNNTVKNTNVNLPSINLVVQGDVKDKNTLNEIQNMIDEGINELYKKIKG